VPDLPYPVQVHIGVARVSSKYQLILTQLLYNRPSPISPPGNC